MQIRYILSSAFDYSKTFLADQGPRFAADYGWPTVSLREPSETDFDVGIVDPRIQPSELEDIRKLVSSSKATYFLRLVDPYQEHALHHFWYRFALELLDMDRVHLMYAYQPVEMTAFIASRARRSKVVHAPYVYHAENELPIDHSSRKHAVIHSGALDPSIYPLRSRMWQARKLWPPYRLMSSGLRHPGYQDLGQAKKHDVIGQAYLRLLASFRFGAVCSSRCRLEFLKYREFAYAGLVPVGDMPATLFDCPGDAWVPWRRNVVVLTQRLRTENDTNATAANFRKFMRERRNAQDMRSWVAQQITALV